MFGELRQDLFSGFGHIQTELQRHLEAKPDPWPPTQNPRPLRWSKHTRTGWDMRWRWTTATPPPTNSRRPVLTCVSPAGERLACASVMRISFRRGESYEWPCVFTIRERGKRENEFNANKTPGSDRSALRLCGLFWACSSARRVETVSQRETVSEEELNNRTTSAFISLRLHFL